jgi:hypothetical protein
LASDACVVYDVSVFFHYDSFRVSFRVAIFREVSALFVSSSTTTQETFLRVTHLWEKFLPSSPLLFYYFGRLLETVRLPAERHLR